MYDAFGGGGVARTVVNLSNHLAQRHDVEVISLFRDRRTPRFSLDPRLRLTVLHERPRRPSRMRAELAARPTELRPAPGEQRMNRLTDLLLRRKLARLSPGVLITTRPSLHLAAARFAPLQRLVTVAQDHSHFESSTSSLRRGEVLTAALPELDTFAVLTEEDATDWRKLLPDTDVRVLPNSLPWAVAETPAPLQAPVVVTAGRLDINKGHDRMIRAFAPVARARPEWQLHIYGAGPQDVALEALIVDLGLADRVLLRGYTLDLRSVLAGASVYALTSRSESFSMVLIEAMSVGLPPVAMDCPRGPRQIIDHGHNGLLVPDGDEAGFTEELLGLVDDAGRRRALGAQALEDSRRYERDRVGLEWEGLFDELLARRGGMRALLTR